MFERRRIVLILAACLLAGQGSFAQNPPVQVSSIQRIHVAPGADHLEMLNWKIFLNFRIDDRMVRFLVDTGAARSSVSPAISQDWLDGKSYAIRRLGYSEGPDVITQRTRDLAVQLPGITCNTSFDVDDVGGETIQVDGRLGRDILSHFRVAIDYGTQTIKLTKPGLDSPPTAPVATGTLYEMGAFIPLSVTDQNGLVHDGEGLVDTANTLPLVIWDRSIAIKPTGLASSIGIAGGARVQTAFIPKLKYGGMERSMVQVAGGTWDKETLDQLISAKAVPPDALGGIGVSVLPNFRLTFDFLNGKVYLEPASLAVPDLANNEAPPPAYPHTDENQRNYDRFVGWWKVATQKNEAGAASIVAIGYCYGFGVEQDYGLMVSWARRAAEQGDARGQCLLGLANLYGYAGLKSDMAVGRSWYEKSAAQGYAEAEYMMGICWEHGLGGPEDLATALTSFQKAAADQNSAIHEDDKKAHNLVEIQKAIGRVQTELAEAAAPAPVSLPSLAGVTPPTGTNQPPTMPEAPH